MDGIDRLLQIVAYYRRRQPQSPEVSLRPPPSRLSHVGPKTVARCLLSTLEAKYRVFGPPPLLFVTW